MCFDFSAFSLENFSDPCQQELHPQARVGLTLFAEGRYFEAHEALEQAWRESSGPQRALYQGILQVGVAYHHILQGNYAGALKMFARAQANLEAFERPCSGVDVPQLREDARRVELALRALGEARIHELDRKLFKPVPMIISE